MRLSVRLFLHVPVAVVLTSMYFKLMLLFSSTFSTLTLGQSSSTTTAIVPAGTALSGDYSGHYRPQIHFSAPVGFINDPNGLFLDDNGTYHLYYQYNPTDTIAGNQHWGHATSTDLYTWENQPIALAPDNSTSFIFSGSIVLDPNNTSGLFPNQTNGVLAYYTLAGPDQQTQDLAYSHDGGYTFTKYANNPLIAVGSSQYRDPKVLWYAPAQHWVMVVAYAQEFTIEILTSPDGLNWTFASNFTHHGLLGSQYECPNLVEMPMQGSDTTMWLLYISINPGSPLGGSIGQYIPGAFNGTHFSAVDAAARIADWGKDNYAGQFFSNIPGMQAQVSIAWASNWQYTNYVPTGPAEGWASAMSLPRVNYLRNATRTGYTLVSLPFGLEGLRGEEAVASNGDLGGNGTLFADLSGGSGAFMIDVNVTGLNLTGLSNTASVNFTIMASGSGEAINGGTFLSADATTWVDRGGIQGWNSIYFTDKFSTAYVLEDSFDFQVVVDRSMIEIFGLEGEKSATLVYYPEALLDTVIIRTGGLNEGVGVSANVYSLEGTWGSGQVQPNGTSNGTAFDRRDLLGGRMWGA